MTKLKLYHVTTHSAAQLIQAEGFRDPEGVFGVIADEAVWRPYALKGVLFFQRPSAHGDPEAAVLIIDVSKEAVAQFELVEEDDEAKEGYREWCISAEVANRSFSDRTIYRLADFA